MKKIYMTMVAMLCGVAAMAQNELTVADQTLETGTKAATLTIGLKNEAAVTAVSFKLALPAGVKAKAVKNFTFNEDRIDMEKVVAAMEDDEAEAGDLYTFDRKSSGSDYMYSFYPQTSRYQVDGDWVAVTFVGNEGDLIYVPLTIDADGEYEIKLYDISIANDEAVAQSVATSTEATCKLYVGVTGINGINAADSKAPIYNVAGQRVSKAQKGVYIQNGKKVAVK
jgi:hypothetical protein